MTRRKNPFELTFYEDEMGNAPAHDWIMEGLSRLKRRALGVAMEEQLEHLGIQVCRSQFGRQLGGGLFEFRLDADVSAVLTTDKPPSQPLCVRLFCHAYGSKQIVVLGGYDKGEDPSPRRQAKEIESARARLKAWRLLQKRKSSKARP